MSYLDTVDAYTICIGILIIVLILIICGNGWMNRSLPPGPWALPLIGNVPQLLGSKNFHLKCLELRQIYGDVLHLKVGGVNVIVILDYKLIQDTLKNEGEKFAFRPNWLHVLNKVYRKKGITWNHGANFERLKNFTKCPLSQATGVENRILDELQSLSNIMDLSRDKPVPLQKVLSKAVTGIICGITFGARYDEKEPDFLYLTGLLEKFHKQSIFQLSENFMPWVRFLPFQSALKDFLDVENKLRTFMKKRIQDHKDTFNEGDIRDFIDHYLNPNKKDRIESCVSDDDISRTIIDLLYIGPDVLTSAILWAILYLVRSPGVQKKIQNELKEVVGTDSVAKISHRAKLPYMRATIKEILRIASPVPMGYPHTVKENVKLAEYTIPKNALVFFHLQAAHNDHTYWKRPQEFRPDRFLDDGEEIKHDCFFPFSVGPRACIGEDLAQNVMFLFLSNLLQKFTFKSPEGASVPSTESVYTNSLRPVEFDVVAISNE